MSDRIRATIVHEFRVPSERVFEAWTDPKLVREWMSASLRSLGLSGEITHADIDARVGGRFLFADLRPTGEAKHWGQYLVLERARTLSFTWITAEDQESNPSRVALVLTPTERGCRADLTHEMDPTWSDFVERTKNGWARMLKHIDALLQATPPSESHGRTEVSRLR